MEMLRNTRTARIIWTMIALTVDMEADIDPERIPEAAQILGCTPETLRHLLVSVPRLYRVTDVAERTGLSKRWLQDALAARRYDCYQLPASPGRSQMTSPYFLDHDQIQAIVDSMRVPARSA